MVTPSVTYRVQFHAGFTFDQAADVADYLAALGVSHLYCSPYLQAAPGSTHGYDVVDPRSLNRELGGASGHARLVAALGDAGLGQVIDIVPNHMAVDPTNPWWWDVLENGPASPHAKFFDIDWEGGDDKSALTVLVPILGDHYGRVLEAGELEIQRDGERLVVRYHEHVLPLSPRSVDELRAAAAERSRDASLETSLDAAEAIDAELASLQGDHDRLDRLLRAQHYRLAHWRTASEELDYRRFFNIETLIGVRVEDADVFAATHALILELVRDGTVQGLRIDHVDGLRDPERYLRQLADASDGCWTVVEKILEPCESLPEGWPVAGTSGYDFLIRVNNLFVDPTNEASMTRCYEAFTGEEADYDEIVHAAKHEIMSDELTAEVDRLTALLAAVCDGHRRHRDHTRRELRDALREFVAAFPVYRSYVTTSEPADRHGRAHIVAAVAGAHDRRPDIDAELLQFIGELAAGDVQGADAIDVAVRLQQLTAPVMAKGVEDTAFYRYHRLVSLNEVGGDPSVFGRPVAEFHRATAVTAEQWPATMLTLSTHDTKRSADVRARLNVLSELPGAWGEATRRWADRNDHHRRDGWPDRNTEYLLYQTLIGAWPIDAERLVAFMAKATREAKVHTAWVDPVAEYDAAVESFARAVLADVGFVRDVESFLDDHRIVARGRRNSLAQTALLLTCPGVPDLYQGSELWDLSLVDPDNRRPVDYTLRSRLLAELPGRRRAPLASDHVGIEKLRLIHQLLTHRRARPAAYVSSTYEPVEVGEGVVAFSRGDLFVVASCRTAQVAAAPVDVPSGRWVDVVTGAPVDGGRRELSTLVGGSAVAVLARDA